MPSPSARWRDVDENGGSPVAHEKAVLSTPEVVSGGGHLAAAAAMRSITSPFHRVIMGGSLLFPHPVFRHLPLAADLRASLGMTRPEIVRRPRNDSASESGSGSGNASGNCEEDDDECADDIDSGLRKATVPLDLSPPRTRGLTDNFCRHGIDTVVLHPINICIICDFYFAPGGVRTIVISACLLRHVCRQ